MSHRAIPLAVAALMTSACATTGGGTAAQTAAAAAPAAVPTATDSAARTAAHDALWALFRASDEANLVRNPLSAIFRGDMRFADQLGDGISDAYYAGERAAAEHDRDALAHIDRAALDETDQIAYDVFAYDQRETLADLAPDMLALTAVRPLNHFYGFQTFYPTFASAEGAAPFHTIADYDNNLKRHEQVPHLIDMTIQRFREGMASGVTETRLTITNVISQLDTQLAQPLEESPYWGPVRNFPADFTAAQRADQSTKLRASLNTNIFPALRRLRTFLHDEYLPRARTEVGLWSMPGGDRLYRRLIEENTTLPLQADEVHNLGLSEVARIRAEMEAVKNEVHFNGTLEQFFEHLRDAPEFKVATREALGDRYRAVAREVDLQIPRFFSTVPRAGLEIRPYEPFRERYEAGGSYDSGTPDGSRPGIFYYNAYDLPSRTTPGITTLYLHEGIPGHHFQVSLAQENTALPPFMRFGGNTAYVEGWALYAETLGYPMGLYRDPYQHFGTLSDEMLRAMRLVVDTGIHAKHWTRDQAIAYMLANSNIGRTDATAEVERYIAIPGQALAYKIGALTIQRLRQRAERELGNRFDIRDFHAQVLMTGSLPMPVLEAKIDHWIARVKAGQPAG